MAILNPAYQIVDAVLTKKGRELLAANDPNFKITKFAVADDEVDYNLWDTSQAASSDYGIKIRNMPLFEATTDGDVALRYKLITLPKGSTLMPTIEVGAATQNVVAEASINFAPTIKNYSGDQTSFTYTAILRNGSLGDLTVTAGAEAITSIPANVASANSKVAVGKAFSFTAYSKATLETKDNLQTVIDIYGNNVGGEGSIYLTLLTTPATSPSNSPNN